ncbi:MAG: high frequency lysogenization protein HflD [Gammaproteobacteria bacterium]|nr:high frequency lysogenization protein HflD [Gammaproteobacteria bacterium]MDH5652269.1 high frequency lysogenization protein HflD [Gammaproteobacteria bacterium]
MAHSIHDRTLALAGIFQATALVKQIAHTGQVDQHDMKVCLESVMDMDPQSVAGIYGGAENLRSGLQQVVTQMSGGKSEMDVIITRYTVSLLHLERKLAKQPALLNDISAGIERAKKQLAHFPINHTNIIANLADIYSNTISKLSPRIMVSGEPHILSDADQANKIRALLLCGMRSAILWRQLGGSRWQIIFGRNKFAIEAERILAEEITTTLQ